MIVLGIDIGDKRIGIAWGDTRTGVAAPVAVLPANEVVELSDSFSNIILEYTPEMLVFGLPKSMSGEDGAQAEKIRAIANKISGASNIPCDFIDERLSSKEAKRILREQGLTEKQMRGKVDSVAASIFLETWIEANK